MSISISTETSISITTAATCTTGAGTLPTDRAAGPLQADPAQLNRAPVDPVGQGLQRVPPHVPTTCLPIAMATPTAKRTPDGRNATRAAGPAQGLHPQDRSLHPLSGTGRTAAEIAGEILPISTDTTPHVNEARPEAEISTEDEASEAAEGEAAAEGAEDNNQTNDLFDRECENGLVQETKVEA